MMDVQSFLCALGCFTPYFVLKQLFQDSHLFHHFILLFKTSWQPEHKFRGVCVCVCEVVRVAAHS